MILTAILNFIHLLGTVTWIGGMITINLVLMPALAAIDPPQRGKMLGAALKRYMPLALGAIVLLLVSGIGVTLFGNLNFSHSIKMVMGIKHLFVAVMVVVGLTVPFVLSPRMQKLAPAPGTPPSAAFLSTQKMVGLLSMINMILGIVVLAFSALLK